MFYSKACLLLKENVKIVFKSDGIGPFYIPNNNIWWFQVFFFLIASSIFFDCVVVYHSSFILDLFSIAV